jgi:hypothetical protein
MNFSADFHNLLFGSLFTLLSGLQEAGWKFVDSEKKGTDNAIRGGHPFLYRGQPS